MKNDSNPKTATDNVVQFPTQNVALNNNGIPPVPEVFKTRQVKEFNKYVMRDLQESIMENLALLGYDTEKKAYVKDAYVIMELLEAMLDRNGELDSDIVPVLDSLHEVFGLRDNSPEED